jgi:uncharacterized protein YrzB (UPF0473 family)
MGDKKNKGNYFTYIDVDGKETEMRILYTFDLVETGKNYIVYTDDTTDENGGIRTYASCYDPNKKLSDLLPIETDKEWKLIEGILANLTKESSAK